MPCEKCKNDDVIEELKTIVKENEEKNSLRHSEFYGRLTTLEKFTSKADVQYLNTMEKLEDIKATLKDILDKPNKRWESVIGALIGAIVGGIVAMYMK